MVRSVSVEEFLEGAADGGVIIDVRTPAEFASGHIIGAVNLPLFSNEERAIVGTLYVRTGREQAIEKGLEFVGVRLAQIVKDAKKISKGRNIYLHCWRGGMRSGSVGWLLSTAGLNVTLLRGGYKAYRRSFEESLEKKQWKMVMLSGSTGSGKTDLLHRLSQMNEQVLDLEGLANHKGSVFGGLGQPEQPTTEQFINKLNNEFRKFDPSRVVWCEGESMSIGHVFMPARLYEIMRQGVIVEIEMATEQRIERIMAEYGAFANEDFIEAFTKIKKRFGPEKSKKAIEFIENGDVRSAARMALEYYDKTYKKNEGCAIQTSFVVDGNDMADSATRLRDFIYANIEKSHHRSN